MTPVVILEHVSKKFRRGERHDSLRDLIPSFARRLVTRGGDEALGDREFWAVRDVSFSVEPGEGLAIIGPNGAGKSTVLKLLTKILKPTLGSCAVKGRIGALIEVAAGFHGDLTGRENVFLQGAIMGMKRPEILRRFDEIVQFAGLEEFIDTPVKRYSSGMNARLGFSVAAHLSPDVLIIDEILSVGDLQFQQKCIDRLLSFKSHGAAIVFVSHNLQAVATHFDRAVVLSRGECRFAGPAAEAVAVYAAGSVDRSHKGTQSAASIVSATLRSAVEGSEKVSPGDELLFVVRFTFSGERNRSLVFGMYVTDAAIGTRLYHATSADLGLEWQPPEGPGEVTVEFSMRANLLRGTYYMSAYVLDLATDQVLDRLEPAAHLTVHETFSRQGNTNLDMRCYAHDTVLHSPAPTHR
ncbi:MAG: ABC transporter ATP-binding protein [Vicinamibacterales bacterium]